ncbi:MAG: hypothetical protein ACLQDQ_07905 [Myxococcaceae bacterium]
MSRLMLQSGRTVARGLRFLPLLLGLFFGCGAHLQPTPSAPAEPAPKTPTATASPWCAAEVHGTAEAEFGVKGPLSELNAEFLEAHARARAQQCVELESKRLVLRYSFGLYEARYRGKEILRTFVVPKAYHPVKDVSHAVFLAALLFAEPPGAARNQQVARTLETLDLVLDQLKEGSSPTATLLPPPLYHRELRLLERTREAVASFSTGGLGPSAQKAYFESVRGDLSDNLHDIAEESLKALHAAVETTRLAISKIDPSAWDSVLVVIAVAHQARAREIGVQYFERVLREPVGEGARNERRLVVAEQLFQASEQYGLLATHLVDQAGGATIFGDPFRMQWDVLGDDAAALDALLPP